MPPEDGLHPDALTVPAVRGRGAGLNPGNRFETTRLHVLGEVLDDASGEHPDGVQVRTQYIDDDAKTIINRVDSPDVDLGWTVNPFRGCEHGCIYCYARPNHETLGYSCGLDFETKILVKRNAADLLRRELASPKWKAEPIVFCGATDPYQPVERKLGLTRSCLEVMESHGQPVRIVTKNRLVTRDIDLLRSLAARGASHVTITITTLDASLTAKMEPRTSAPRDPLRAIRELTEAGIRTAVMMAPIVPGLTDHEVPRVLDAAAEAGATSATYVMLRLPHQIKALFLDWLKREVPLRAHRVEQAIRRTRGGRLYDARHGSRLTGTGPLAEHVERSFGLYCRRFGLRRRYAPISGRSFQRPVMDGQLGLFDDAGTSAG